MKQIVSLVLVLGLCAPRVGWTAEIRTPTAGGDPVSLAGSEPGDGPLARRVAAASTLATGADRQQDRPAATVAAVREAARRISPGEKVKVRTMAGGKVEGTLVSAGDTGIVVETRPGAREDVPYESLKSIEHQGRGMPGWGKALIITGVVVAALFVIGNCVAAADSGGHKTWCN